MDLIERIKAIMFAPAEAWREIAREPTGPAILLQAYVAALAAIPAVADFIGMTAIGYALPGKGIVRVEILPAFMAALFAYVMSFVIVSLQAIAIYGFAPLYGARRDMAGAFKLAVYSFTPGLACRNFSGRAGSALSRHSGTLWLVRSRQGHAVARPVSTGKRREICRRRDSMRCRSLR